MSASRDPSCPECDGVMIAGKRMLLRIFGDVRSFECLNCEYMFLTKHPFQPDPSNPEIVLQQAAE
jgi:rubredoxin